MINEQISMNMSDKLIESSSDEIVHEEDDDDDDDDSSVVHSSLCGTDDENSSETLGIVKTIALGTQTQTGNSFSVSNAMADMSSGRNLLIQNCKDVHFGDTINLEIHANITEPVKRKSRKQRSQSRVSPNTSNTTDEEDEDTDEEVYFGRVEIVQRKKWLAQKPMKQMCPMKKPIKFVSISHTETESSKDKDTNIKFVRDLQNHHIEHLKLKDIAYNFLIGCDGMMYEGRGWNSYGCHGKNPNRTPVEIAFIGNFVEEPPSQEALYSYYAFIEEAVSQGYLQKRHHIYSNIRLTDALPRSLGVELKKSRGRLLRNKIMPETFHSKFLNTIRQQLTRVFNIIQDFLIYLFRGRRQ